MSRELRRLALCTLRIVHVAHCALSARDAASRRCRRLGFASLVYYSLPCGCDADGAPLLRPVQYAALIGCAALALPTAAFIARE
eukprot:7011865-Prymnesium_polylepis.1